MKEFIWLETVKRINEGSMEESQLTLQAEMLLNDAMEKDNNLFKKTILNDFFLLFDTIEKKGEFKDDCYHMTLFERIVIFDKTIEGTLDIGNLINIERVERLSFLEKFVPSVITKEEINRFESEFSSHAKKVAANHTDVQHVTVELDYFVPLMNEVHFLAFMCDENSVLKDPTDLLFYNNTAMTFARLENDKIEFDFSKVPEHVSEIHLAASLNKEDENQPLPVVENLMLNFSINGSENSLEYSFNNFAVSFGKFAKNAGKWNFFIEKNDYPSILHLIAGYDLAAM